MAGAEGRRQNVNLSSYCAPGFHRYLTGGEFRSNRNPAGASWKLSGCLAWFIEEAGYG
jgi:hypothetical protein